MRIREVSTQQIREWIRARETTSATAAPGSKQERDAQRQIDYLCRELGRRGED